MLAYYGADRYTEPGHRTMRLTMLHLHRRNDSSLSSFRAKVPADVAKVARGRRVSITFPPTRSDPEHVATVTLSTHAKLALGSRDPETINVRLALAAAHMQMVFSILRHGPVRLTHKELVALSRRVYDHFVDRFGDNPGDPERWARLKAWNDAVRSGKQFFSPMLDSFDRQNEADQFGSMPAAKIAAMRPDSLTDEDCREAREVRYGNLARWVLETSAIALASDQWDALLVEVERAVDDAARRLHMAANGDYRPDPAEKRFPVVTPAVTLTLWNLFDAWVAERGAVKSTQDGNRKALADLIAHLGHDDAARITSQDLVAWKDRMLADGALSRRTIDSTKLSAVKSILRLAARNHRIPSDPGRGITVEWKVRPGERMKGHDDDGARRILEAALEQQRPVLKWVPWIMALTGARIGEACALRGRDVRQQDGVWVLDFASKTAAGERSVPIHKGLIDRGFLDFAQSRGAGYLFFDERHLRRGATAKPGKSAANDVREWIGTLGLNVGMEHRTAPAHGFRHLFTTLARKVGMDAEKREYMLGHELGGERGTYGAMAGLAIEIAKLPDPLAG